MYGWTPPSWMRHITPWRVLNFIDRHSHTCWAGMVMWKLGYGWSWWPCMTCFMGPKDWGDYCGKYNGPDRPAPKEE